MLPRLGLITLQLSVPATKSKAPPLHEHPPRGRTFRFVSHEALLRHPRAIKIFATPKKTDTQLVGWPFEFRPTPLGMSPKLKLSPAARVCTIFGFGNPHGRQCLHHVDPNNPENQGERFKAALDGYIQRCMAKRDPRAPISGYILGGSRMFEHSQNTRDIIMKAFQEARIPFSILWGLPDSHYSMSLMTVPKEKGLNLVGICQSDEANTKRPVLEKLQPLLPLKRLPNTRLHSHDAPVTSDNWSKLFSTISLLPEDRVLVGDTVVISRDRRNFKGLTPVSAI